MYAYDCKWFSTLYLGYFHVCSINTLNSHKIIKEKKKKQTPTKRKTCQGAVKLSRQSRTQKMHWAEFLKQKSLFSTHMSF